MGTRSEQISNTSWSTSIASTLSGRASTFSDEIGCWKYYERQDRFCDNSYHVIRFFLIQEPKITAFFLKGFSKIPM